MVRWSVCGWLVWVNGPLRQFFSLYQADSSIIFRKLKEASKWQKQTPREAERREKIDERKKDRRESISGRL